MFWKDLLFVCRPCNLEEPAVVSYRMMNGDGIEASPERIKKEQSKMEMIPHQRNNKQSKKKAVRYHGRSGTVNGFDVRMYVCIYLLKYVCACVECEFVLREVQRWLSPVSPVHTVTPV